MDKAKLAKRNRRRGARVQNKTARLWDAKNVSHLGGEDLYHNVFSIETKSRKTFVGAGWLGQAIKNCPEGKIPLVHIHVTGQRYSGDMVLLNWQHFKHCCDY